MWGHDNVGKICKVAGGGRAICRWQAQFVKVAPDSDLPIVGFSILFNSSRLWTFTLLGIATIRRFQQQRCVHWWELHTSPAIFEVSFQRCDVGACPSQVNSCHFIIQLQRKKLVCNAYYVYQEMIRGGFQFRASFGISVIPVTGIFCEIGLGACEDAWSLPAMLACYHGLCNQAKEKRTCGALPLGPKETHHKLEARGRGALFWALVR